MKKFFLLVAGLAGSLFCHAQTADVLNSYHAVFIPQLYYGKDKTDIYDIRKTVIEKLDSCGVPLFLDEHKIPMEEIKNPCTMLHCLVNNAPSSSGKNTSLVYIVFLDCKNDTVLRCSADATIQVTFSNTRSSFVKATKEALGIFSNYKYIYNHTDSTSSVTKIENDSDQIQWTPGKKLTWDDFKGTAPENDPADALTFTSNQTQFQSFGLGNRIEVESQVICYFIRSKSWVKHGKESDYLLNHEQRHFDLAEAGAREFRKRLKQAHFTSENFRDETARITKEIDEKYKNLQLQYDNESDHSRVEEKQREWNNKIDDWMKEFESFKQKVE